MRRIVPLLIASALASGNLHAQKPKAPKPPATALLAAADEIARQVAALRGLQPKSALNRGVLSRDEIGVKLKARLDKEYSPDEVKNEARVLQRLGLLPANVDYGKLL